MSLLVPPRHLKCPTLHSNTFIFILGGKKGKASLMVSKLSKPGNSLDSDPDQGNTGQRFHGFEKPSAHSKGISSHFLLPE